MSPVFYIIWISSSFALWLVILAMLVSARLWQIRTEILPSISGKDLFKKRRMALLFGILFFFSFAAFQRINATERWLTGAWSMGRTDFAQLYFLPLGATGVLLCLWWAFSVVMGPRLGNRTWLRFFILGIVTGFLTALISQLK